ncbi:MAG: FAD-binding protein, partial [Nitrospinota bacterium]
MAMVKKDEFLRNHTTFKIGGPAKLFIVPDTDEELARAIAQYPKAFVIGGGSNLLVSDEGLDEVISMKNIKGFEILPQAGKAAAISALAGSSFTALVRKAHRAELSGLEFAFGIPGTVGGAVRMNAGASGGEVKDCLETVTILHEGRFRELSADELKLSYRSSLLPQGAIITKAVFRLNEGGRDEILEKMK